MTEPLVTLDFNEAVELAKRAVAEKGEDYVYPKAEAGWCINFDSDTSAPSCIVGHILAYKGMTYAQMLGRSAAVNDEALLIDRVDYNNSGICTLVGDGLVRADTKTEHFLSELQQLQDSGTSWGKSLRSALEYITPRDYGELED